MVVGYGARLSRSTFVVRFSHFSVSTFWWASLGALGSNGCIKRPIPPPDGQDMASGRSCT